jgi:translation elongation factor P/translation initiation factor 5A
MKDFVILAKPLKFAGNLDGSHIRADSVQIGLLMQETYKNHPHIRDYVIDEKTIQFQAIDGKMCVVFLAFRK